MRKTNLDKGIVRTVGKKAQVTLPKELRDYYGIREGNRVLFRFGDKGIEIVPDRLTEEELREAIEEGQRIVRGERVNGVKRHTDVAKMFKEIEEEDQSVK